jgi:fatty-acid peroxygenase
VGRGLHIPAPMPKIPHDPALDSTLSVLREGYTFISARCHRFGTDLFRMRLMGLPAVCIHGREAAQLFYDDTKFQRSGALPRRVVTSLFGKGALHTLDGAAHQNRKAAFLSLMQPEKLERLMDGTAGHWRAAIRRWERAGTVVLFEEVEALLTRSVCEWAGVPLAETDVARRASDFGLMVDAFGGVGPRLWKGKLARARTEAWISKVVGDIRRGRMRVDPGAAAAVMANLAGVNGKLLPAKTAAIELINVLRPTVAIAWYITFAALALHEHGGARANLAREPVGGDPGSYAEFFMQEVRRFYPFAPFLGARVRAPFVWKGHTFRKGTLVLLDVYGTNHDPALWESPEEFRPERFSGWTGDAFDLIPQGGGALRGHRCPGEWITMHNVVLALHFLTRGMTYEVAPDQDLSFDLARMPTGPRNRFVIRNVRVTAELDQKSPKLPSAPVARASVAAIATGEIHGTALRG